jgi:hypothetical protein
MVLTPASAEGWHLGGGCLLREVGSMFSPTACVPGVFLIYDNLRDINIIIIAHSYDFDLDASLH